MNTKRPESNALHNEIQHKQMELCSAILPLWGRLLATSQAQSETAVAEMLSAFSEMTPFLEMANQHMARNSSSDQAAKQSLELLIERMYVGFQYQDRISQMLALVHTDMARLQELVEATTPTLATLDKASWLDRLNSQYAMAEQRRDHHEVSGAQAPVDASDETTFF